MPCAGPAYSCNSLIVIRSPLGELRLHAAAPAPPQGSTRRRLARALRAAAERFARARLGYMAREIDPWAIDRLAASDPEAARELRKLFGL
jgi:hypothetical protein